MTLQYLLFFFISLCCCFLLTSSHSSPHLTTTYYHKTCPAFNQIIQDTTTAKQINSPTTAAATLRLFLHDCLISGCDASILISSTPFSKSERDADINLSLPGDAFDLLVRAKTAIELACPGVVSCADILAVATRNLVTMIGGPFYTVRLGRRDGLISKASSVGNNIPESHMSVTKLIKLFSAVGFSIEEMVALTGAHTIGLAHCKEFSKDIYNYTVSTPTDPSYNPRYASGLRKACSNHANDPTLSVFNDIMSPNVFDNMYFKNLERGLGIMKSDRDLYSDPRTKRYVELYGRNETKFFEAFGEAMEKLSEYGVKSGRRGEIRRRCDVFNS